MDLEASIDENLKRISEIIPLRKIQPTAVGDATSPWVQTASGAAFDLAGQDETQVNIHDIAASLSKLCRFTGATCTFYSVAQHSVVVSDALKRHGPLVQLLGLMHDAHEAYIGDITRPVAALLGSIGSYSVLHDLKAIVQTTIHRKLRLPEKPSNRFLDLIAEADEAALATELRDVMATPQRDWGLSVGPLKKPITALPWHRAEEQFLDRYHTLSVAAGTQIGIAS